MKFAWNLLWCFKIKLRVLILNIFTGYLITAVFSKHISWKFWKQQECDGIYPNLLIYTDSQAAIKFRINAVSIFILIHEFQGFLAEISDHSNVTLLWHLGHRFLVRNCIADELTRSGTNLTISDELQNIIFPIVTFNLDIVHLFYGEAQCRWQQEGTYNIARLCLTRMDKQRTDSIVHRYGLLSI